MSLPDVSPFSADLEPAERERRLYQTVLSATPDLIYVFDREHRFIYANDALLAMWGRTLEESLGKTCLELGYEPWHAAMHDREIDQVVSTKSPIRGEVPFDGATGRRIYDYIFVPVLDAHGEVEAIAGTTRDITERKRKEDALQFLVDLNTATQPLTDPDAIMATTARLLGQYLDVHRCAYAEVENESIFVITGDYLNGVPSIVGRWPVAAFGAECHRLMKANQRYVVTDTEHDPRIGADDRPAYRATNIGAVICVPLHKAGRFTAAMAVHQTTPREWTVEEIELVELVVARCWEALERARVMRDLRRSENRLRFMAEAMPQKIFTTTAAGEVDYVNARWTEFTGRAVPKLTSWAWLELVHPDDRAENLRRWHHCVRTGEPLQIEHRFLRHDGVYRWNLTRVQPMKDPSGRILMWIGSSTDIEDQKQNAENLEQIIAERTAKLRETIGELESFSYSIAHDMRAPLRALQGFSEILLHEHAQQLDPEGLGFLRRIAAAALRMDKLIQDVLNYSRLVRGESPQEPVSLDPLLRSIVETYPAFAPDRADIVIDGPLPEVRGNEAMLTQIFSNLLGNAVKFVPSGVRPRVRIWSEPTNNGVVRVLVRDNGIGIPPKHHAKIFDIFTQVTPSYGGTGIGLSIVKKATERMSGRVGVTSDQGQGSTFWVELPKA